MSLLDSVLDPRLSLAIKIGKGLIDAGLEIFDILKGKDKLSNEDLQAIIDRENQAQKKAREELLTLLETTQP